jgi:hypothetical protein
VQPAVNLFIGSFNLQPLMKKFITESEIHSKTKAPGDGGFFI